MPGASPASLFPGGSVRVGRTEVSSNAHPRGMVVSFVREVTEPGLQASWFFTTGSQLLERHR